MKSGSKNSPAPSSPLKLERILGLTSVNNTSFVSSPSGDIFYAAGCFAVKYNPDDNKQKFFFKASKPISSIAISSDGKYLAVGERGHNPSILVYDVVNETCLTTLVNHHKHGVGCLAFSPDSRYLVSVGFKHDKQLLVWQWDVSRKLSTQKVGNKVHSISYHSSGDYFVTAGDRHLKWWYVSEVLEGEAIAVEGKAASILEDQRMSVFVDVVCGSDALEHLTYCTTSTGVLSVFNEERLVAKTVQLQSSSSYCMELIHEPGTSGLLVVGCADGAVQCFTPATLDLLARLPPPAPLPKQPTLTGAAAASVTSYPAALALRKAPGSKTSPAPKLSVIYADHSLFVWDITDLYKVVKYRSFQFHHGCVWDLHFIENEKSDRKLPPGTFVTCSSDNSIKFWNTDPRAQRESKFKSIYSREMLHNLELIDESGASSADRSAIANSIASTISSFTMNMQSADQSTLTAGDISRGMIDSEFPSRPQHPDAPRCLSVHPYGRELAVGSKTGRIRVFDLQTMQQTQCSEAHAAEILSLNFSPPLVSADQKYWFVKNEDDETLPDDKDALVLLASAGRDRLVHVFNASEHYSHLHTLDHHSSSVTIVKFTSDGKKLISCGGDKNMVFNHVNGPDIHKFKAIATPNGTINGLAVDTSNKFVVTSGQDKRLNVWNLVTGKHMRAYKSESTQELYKSDLDPSGTYIATCSFDKSVSVYDFFSGDLVAQITGHSELVTGVRFSPDGRYLLTIGGDGCIMMWRVSDVLVKGMQDRLVEMLTRAQKQSNKAVLKASQSLEQQRPATTGALPIAPPLVSSSAAAPPPPAASESFMPPVPPADEKRPATAGSVSSAGHKKWGNRAEPNTEYELFGRKIVPAAHNANKFTVELSDSVLIRNVTPDKKPAAKSPGLTSPNRLASTIEARDDVVLSAMSDDERPPSKSVIHQDSDDDSDDDDGSYLFKPAAEVAEYESDFEKEDENHDTTQKSTGGSVKSQSEADADELLNKAQGRVKELERSTEQMENWLANMLRSECKLDESVTTTLNDAANVTTDGATNLTGPTKVDTLPSRRVVKRTMLDVSMEDETIQIDPTAVSGNPAEHHDYQQDHLNQSLSSTFFKSLRTSKAIDAHTKAPAADSHPLPPAPPASGIAENAAPTPAESQDKIELKVKDRAATVARMKERMRVMGMEKARKASEAAAAAAAAGGGNNGAFPPPPPSKGQEEGYESDRTAEGPSDNETEGSSGKGGEGSAVLTSSELIAKELQAKADSYRNTLRELERAKQKASQSFQELVGLRSSLEESIGVSRRGSRPGSGGFDVNRSIAESDELLSLFKSSFAHLSETAQHLQFSGTSSLGAGGGGAQTSSFGGSRVSESGKTFRGSTGLSSEEQEAEVSNILEKYSDRLVQMVSEKMLGKLNK